MAQQTTSGVRGIPRPVQSFSAKTAAPADEVPPVRVRLGAHGLLHGRGKTPIGRGF